MAYPTLGFGQHTYGIILTLELQEIIAKVEM